MTERGIEVLVGLAGALPTAEIGALLRISEATATTHLERVPGKLEMRERVQPVVFVYEVGQGEPGPPGVKRIPDAPARHPKCRKCQYPVRRSSQPSERSPS